MRNRAKKGEGNQAPVFWAGGWSVSCRGRLTWRMNEHNVVWQPFPIY